MKLIREAALFGHAILERAAEEDPGAIRLLSDATASGHVSFNVSIRNILGQAPTAELVAITPQGESVIGAMTFEPIAETK